MCISFFLVFLYFLFDLSAVPQTGSPIFNTFNPPLVKKFNKPVECSLNTCRDWHIPRAPQYTVKSF